MPRLRRITFKHHGFGDVLNDAVVDAEQNYIVEHLPDRLRVEEYYEQRKLDDMKKALEEFWSKRSIAVEVSSSLTQVAAGSRYAILLFDVYPTLKQERISSPASR